MGTNKYVSVVLLDVSQGMGCSTENGITFFERSKNCLKRMVLRKMFSQDNDEIGIILFGSDSTDNELATNSLYQNISKFCSISLPSWNLYRDIEAIKMNERYKSDWIEAVVVAINYLKIETEGRRFKTKQIIVFSNCAGDTSASEATIDPVIDVLEGEKVQFIVVGNDMEEECSQGTNISQSLQLMFNAVTKFESGVHFSFDEIEKDLEYFEKKRKMGRLLKVNLTIGSNIHLPVRWMKVTNEETRFKWDYPPASDPRLIDKNYTSSDQTTSVEYVTDTVKKTNFGGSLVELGYADLEAMKRKSGTASFYYIGSIKSSKINRSMFVGNDVYVVVADKDVRSVSMFSAFVDALINAGKYGIARRVPVKNGKVSIGALLPVSDDLGKAMYFLKLPYAEWVRKVPEKYLSEDLDDEVLKVMDDLIEGSLLPEDLSEEGKGLLVRDPTFQSRCHALSLRALGKLPEFSLPDFPESLQRILHPFSPSKCTEDALSRLAEIFPYVSSEKIHLPRKLKSNANLPHPQAVAIIKHEDKKEVEDILNFVGDDLDKVFSEEMFSE